jgi:hypothetical protein
MSQLVSFFPGNDNQISDPSVGNIIVAWNLEFSHPAGPVVAKTFASDVY